MGTKREPCCTRRRGHRRHLHGHRAAPARRHAAGQQGLLHARGSRPRRGRGLRRAAPRRRGSLRASVVEVVHGTTVASNTILQKIGARDRADHHARLSRRARDRPHPHARHVRPDLGEAGAAGRAPAPARGRRADRRRRRGRARRSIEAACASRPAAPCWPTASKRSRSASSTATRNPAHEQRAERSCAQALPDARVTASCARPARDQGVRAHQHDGGQRLSAARDAPLPATLASGPARHRRRGAAAGHGLQRRHDGGAAAGEQAGVRGRRPDRPAAWSAPRGSARRSATREPHRLRHGRHDRQGRRSSRTGEPSMTTEYEFRDGISTSSRFIKAGGYMLKVPAIDIAEVGAGGGSIARHRRRRPPAGRAGVGRRASRAPPATASATHRPTVTDANVVLGFLNPARLAGGALADRRAPSARGDRAPRRAPARPRRSRMPRTASARSPTPTWRARSAPSPSSAAATRAIFTLVAFGGSGPRPRGRRGPRARHPPRARAAALRACSPRSACWPATWSTLRPRGGGRSTSVVRRAGARAARRDGRGSARRARRRRLSARARARSTAQADLRYVGQACELVIRSPVAGSRPTSLRALREALRARVRETYGYRRRRAARAGQRCALIGHGVRDQPPRFRERARVARRRARARDEPRSCPSPAARRRVETPVVARAAVSRSAPAPGRSIIESSTPPSWCRPARGRPPRRGWQHRAGSPWLRPHERRSHHLRRHQERARLHRRRDGLHGRAHRALRDRQGRDGLLGRPLRRARASMVAQAKTIAQHLGAIPDAMAAVLAEVRRRSARRRRRDHERSLSRRHASARHLHVHADLLRRGGRGLRRS